MATNKQPTIGILSIGDMGLGIAKLLVARGFTVLTNCEGRSQDTVDRVTSANIGNTGTDLELVRQADVILSVVPPRDAEATLKRCVAAFETLATGEDASTREHKLYYCDMNAVAPSTIKAMARLIPSSISSAFSLIDGSIIGGPPAPKSNTTPSTNTYTNTQTSKPSSSSSEEWSVPLMPLSGHINLPTIFPHLTSTLNMHHISSPTSTLGSSSGLKMCFASLTKGYTAIAIQAYTTAYRLGVLEELQHAMKTQIPGRVEMTERGVVNCVPKAYRWVREMEEIGRCHREEGGFVFADLGLGGVMEGGDGDGEAKEEKENKEQRGMFEGAALVYKMMAEDDVLSGEKIGKRKRGTTVEDVAAALAEGMDAKRKKA